MEWTERGETLLFVATRRSWFSLLSTYFSCYAHSLGHRTIIPPTSVANKSRTLSIMFLDIREQLLCVVATPVEAPISLSSGVPRCAASGTRFLNATLMHPATLGAGILWSDWNGFSGGDLYAANTDAGAAVLNTNIATAMSALVWIMWNTIYYKKPSVLGRVNDMITGLAAISPAAGVVAGWGAIIIGIGLR
ncbi:hypothetical protein BS47DRAFT_1400720 [Hydnum rufescens UP504]|uniref:Ammonium transporter AmtB-like domain-containing protein n=1 Tax=Hydnum rufescens UP504 TaxID=1448309 RepID=A0A9P6AGW9_9AGAM|nr:hypothetical protein BS47DRAFT_1400720 [Hydnum rufescens UP504]